MRLLLGFIRPAIAFGAALSALLAAPAFAQEDAAITLDPSSGWSLDFDDDSCFLRRGFGDREQQTMLELRKFMPSTRLRVSVVSRQFETQDEPPRFRFSPDQEIRSYNLPAYNSGDDGVEGVSFYAHIAPRLAFGVETSESRTDRRERLEAEAVHLYLADAFEQNIVFETGSMAPPMKALYGCMRVLADSQGTLKYHDDDGRVAAVAEDSDKLLKHIRNGFPSGLVRRPGVSTFQISVVISDGGKVTSCLVTEPVVKQRYQDFACKPILKDAKFVPAKDGDGNAIASFKVLSVRYSSTIAEETPKQRRTRKRLEAEAEGET